MKTKRPWSHDDWYDASIGEWEDYLRSSRLSDRRMTWYRGLLLPFLLIGIGFAGSSWQAWLGIIGLYYVFVMVFSFFEEINENIRYTRHKVVKVMGSDDVK